VVLALALFSGTAAAQAPIQPPEPGSELIVSVVTMGPGTYVWERFGHNAIRITDTRTGADTTYNYGMFDFEHENFYRNFALGRMDYWMEGHDANREIGFYMRSNRSVWVQVLDLTPRQALELREFLQWNARPENRFYRYHYYYDNCSTRVRDALDRVLDGTIRRATDTVPAGTTFRTHTRRLTEYGFFTRTGIDIGLGRPTDRPISRWEEMFLPLALHEYLRGMSVADDTGGMHPLVRAEETLYLSTAEPPPAEPTPWWPGFLIAGLGIGGMLAWAGRRASRSRAARRFIAIAGGGWSLVAGVIGLVLAWLWLFTDHTTSYYNENLLHFSLLSLPLIWWIPRAFAGGQRFVPAARFCLWGAAALSLAGLLLKLLPGSQGNAGVIALALPIHLGLLSCLAAPAAVTVSDLPSGARAEASAR